MSVIGLLGGGGLCALGFDNSELEIVYMHRPQSEFWPSVCDAYELFGIYLTEVR